MRLDDNQKEDNSIKTTSLLLAGVRITVMLAVMCAWPSCGQSTNKSKPLAVTEPRKILTVDLGDGMVMQFVPIRPGMFLMGSVNGFSNEGPVHRVMINDSFYLGKYKVTQEQWEKIMGNNPSNFKGAKNPVDSVSWDDCQNFLAKLQEKLPGQMFQLPTEAEWEYACRAGSTNDYCYGDRAGSLREYAWYGSNANCTTHPVGEKKPNAWGLYDMHGNVLEWCQDVYHQTYEGAPTDGSAWTQVDAASRVLRGGSWSYDAPSLRSAARGKGAVDVRDSYCRFRVRLSWRVGGELKLQL